MASLRITYVVGARPNFVKMAPVISALRGRLPQARHALIHTGQHYDHMMSEIFLRELDVPEPDYMLGVGSGSHAAQTARVMERIEPVLADERPDLIVVPGDVNSTLAAALTAAKMGIRVAHLESGLRSFDRDMPEEINRVLTDQVSDLLFLHSPEAVSNLEREGVPPERIHFVGNTMIDSLVAVEPRFRDLRASEAFQLTRGSYLLVTLHRPALVDTDLLFDSLGSLAEVAREIPVLFPAHPRTTARIAGSEVHPNIRVVPPVGYLEFLSLQADAAAVLTDSGGVQEETTYLGVPCFTLRDNTERPVTLRAGTNTLLGLDPRRILDIPSMLSSTGRPNDPPKYWDGQAASRVADAVVAWHDADETAGASSPGAVVDTNRVHEPVDIGIAD